MDSLNALFRWLHIFAGIIWIGMLYFFNFVNGPFAATMDGETKKKVVPELMPRALWWFRMGAAWTWFTGLFLLLLVFYHGQLMFDGDKGWGVEAIVMVALVFVAPFLYDALHKSPLGRNARNFGIVCFVLVGVVLWLMQAWAGFGYRAATIHIAGLFGTVMAFNVWFRIWPAQQKIITAVKQGVAPDAALAAVATARSRHNVYMSVPLVWGMINQHTVTVPSAIGLPDGLSSMLFLVITALGWHIVWQLYRRAGKVKGF